MTGCGGYQEKELLEDYTGGKRKAFDELYDRFYDQIYVFCYNTTGHKEESQDLTLVTLNRVFSQHKEKSFDSLVHMRNFLYVCARNACIDHFRSTEKQLDRRCRPVHTLMGEDELVNDELDIAYLISLNNAINTLPDQERKVIRLLFFESLKFEEAAAAMRISISTLVRYRAKALQSLGKLFRTEIPVEALFLLLCLPWRDFF